MRSIRRILPAQKVNMGGFILDQALPLGGVDQIDPFLLVHHADKAFPGGQKQSDVGVGPHPHRGFAPVTFIFKGAVHHRDSIGNSHVIWEGGTQWMNSGKGIVHSERPPKEAAEDGGHFEIIQFWVNAPAAKKMDPPSYQPLTAEDTPWVTSPDGKVKTGVVAGDFRDRTGKVKPDNELLILRLEMQAGGKETFPVPQHYNVFIYQLDGQLKYGSSTTTAKDLVWFNNDDGTITVEAEKDTRAILLAGKPIGEPVYSYGPFVMNTQREIMQAMHDYQSGKMGELNEQFD